MQKIIILAVILMMTSIAGTVAQNFKVIVNNANPAASLSSKDVSGMFLKKKSKWENGTAIMPVDLAAGSATRESFTQQIHGKSVAAIRSYWQQAVFSGSASAPIEKSNDNEIIEFVKNNAGAIGYISSGTNPSGVKTLKISE